MASVESYKHRFAKETLAQWLRASLAGKYGDYVELDPVSSRVNRGEPYHGVFVEYPICINNKNEIVGDLTWDEIAKDDDGKCWDIPPSYEECIRMGLLPIVIFDVVVIHKGNPAYALEVVHRNGISLEKSAYIERIKDSIPILTVFTIEADWILSQIQKPARLKCSEWCGYASSYNARFA